MTPGNNAAALCSALAYSRVFVFIQIGGWRNAVAECAAVDCRSHDACCDDNANLYTGIHRGSYDDDDDDDSRAHRCADTVGDSCPNHDKHHARQYTRDNPKCYSCDADVDTSYYAIYDRSVFMRIRR